MPNLGTTELLIIAFVVILLFGSKKLPDAARSIGRSLRIFKAETKGLSQDEQPAASATSTTQQPAPAQIEAAAQPASAQGTSPQAAPANATAPATAASTAGANGRPVTAGDAGQR